MGLKREDLWITSKLWNNRHDAVEAALNESIAKLGVGYLDLYLMHWPVGQDKYGESSIEYADAWKGMEKQLEAGKTRHIGVANFAPHQLEKLIKHAKHTPQVHQME